MISNWPPSTFALCLAAALGMALAVVGWRRRAVPGAAAFALLMLAVAEWALLSGLEKIAGALPARVLTSKFEYLGIASVPPLWLLFALAYTRQEGWLSRINLGLLWIIPALTMAAAFSNDWHRLLWPSVTTTAPEPGAPLIYAHGPVFWIAAAYNYVLIFAGTLALLWALVRFPAVYRRQAIAILLAVAFPWMGNLVYLAGLSPFRGLDLTPFAFTLSGVIFAWTIFRFQLLDLVPVARETVVESMSDGVFVLDAHNRFVDINPAAQQMIGAPAAALIGQPVEVVLARWADYVARYKEVMDIRTTVEVGAQTLDLRIAPLRDRRAAITGRVVVVRDITERRVLEKMRDDLTHTMVHDLRNPLASISTALDMLTEDQRPASEAGRANMLKIAQISAHRMVALVNAILDVSRLESGEMPVEREATRPEALAAEALSTLAPLAAEKHQRLVNAIPPGLAAVAVDRVLIGRVLENLIGNALKFTPEGGVIQVGGHARPEGDVAISVTDDGPGIPDEMQGRLFQKFHTGPNPNRGSGLGLAFCRLAVEAHGGRIWAESAPGAGSTFTFTLPATDVLPASER